MPFIIRDPEAFAHRVEDLHLGTVDIMPTLLGMMGLNDRIPKSVDGIDYSKGLVTGDFASLPKPASALYLNSMRKGVRTDRYIYQVDKDGKTELYDNGVDPYQLNNLDPDAIDGKDLAFLKAELGRWLTKAGDGWANERMFPERITYP